MGNNWGRGNTAGAALWLKSLSKWPKPPKVQVFLKWPELRQFWSNWGLVFCKHPNFDMRIWFYKQIGPKILFWKQYYFWVGLTYFFSGLYSIRYLEYLFFTKCSKYFFVQVRSASDTNNFFCNGVDILQLRGFFAVFCGFWEMSS